MKSFFLKPSSCTSIYCRVKLLNRLPAFGAIALMRLIRYWNIAFPRPAHGHGHGHGPNPWQVRRGRIFLGIPIANEGRATSNSLTHPQLDLELEREEWQCSTEVNLTIYAVCPMLVRNQDLKLHVQSFFEGERKVRFIKWERISNGKITSTYCCRPDDDEPVPSCCGDVIDIDGGGDHERALGCQLHNQRSSISKRELG